MKKLMLALLVMVFLLAACGSPAEETPVANNAPANAPDTAEEEQGTDEDAETSEEPAVEVEPDKIKLALSPYASYAVLYFGVVEGFFAEQNLDVEIVEMVRPAEILAALASGQIDVAANTVDVGSLAAIAEGAGIMMVADKGFLDPNAACSYSGWFATDELLASGELDDINNIVGKKVSLTRATYFEYAMDKLLEPAGLSVDDLEIVEMPIPTRYESIVSGAIDIGVFAEPWILRGRQEGAGDIWVSYEESLPYAQYAVIYYGSTLIEDNPDAGNRFMAGYMKAVQMYNEGKTDRNVELMAEFTQSSLEEARDTCWQTFQPDLSINGESVLDFQTWAFNKGYLDQELTIDQIYDESFLEYARSQMP